MGRVPKTEHGINLDHPLVVLFRRLMLEEIAVEQRESTRCPKCNLLLPYTEMTVTKGGLGRYCPICEFEF